MFGSDFEKQYSFSFSVKTLSRNSLLNSENLSISSISTPIKGSDIELLLLVGIILDLILKHMLSHFS